MDGIKLFVSIVMIAICLVFIAFDLGWCSEYHVKTTGTKTSGTSADWTDAECYATIVEAFAEATNNADTVFLSNETHALTTTVTVRAGLYNQSGSADYTNCVVQFDAVLGGGFRTITSAITTTIRGITFKDNPWGTGNNAIMVQSPVVCLVNDCAFTNNAGKSGAAGGSAIGCALGAAGVCTISIADSYFYSNTARLGGAIYCQNNVTLSLDGCYFDSNHNQPGYASCEGGAVSVKCPLARGNVSIVDCVFVNNDSTGPDGGAASILDASPVALTTSRFENNRTNIETLNAFSSSGGVQIKDTLNDESGISATVTSCKFTGNYGVGIDHDNIEGDGGGIKFWGTDPTDMTNYIVIGCIFTSNFADQGGGLYSGRYSQGSVDNCWFQGNMAYNYGGAIYRGGVIADCEGQTLTATCCVFYSNTAGYDRDGSNAANALGRGGAMGTRQYARLVARNCFFQNNGVRGSVGEGDSVHHWDAGGILDNYDLRSVVSGCIFSGSGSSYELYGDENAFSSVSGCIYPDGEFFCTGVTPTNSVLTE